MSTFALKKKALSCPILDCTVQQLGEHSSIHAPPQRADEAECMSRILDHVYLGSWRDAEDKVLIDRERITHVLNIAKEFQEPPPFQATAGLKRKSLEVSDQIESATALMERLDEAFAFIDSAKRANGRCLVHCRRGISRSPTVVIAYIMQTTGRTYEESKSQVQGCRYICPNLGFHDMLQEWKPKYHQQYQFGSGFGMDSPEFLPRTDTESTLEPSSAESTSTSTTELPEVLRQVNLHRSTLFPPSPSNGVLFS